MIARVRFPHWLALIMLVAYLLRLLLIVNGGQFFFPDEGRYRRAVGAAHSFMGADFRSGLDRLLWYNKHHAFSTVGLVPALAHGIAFRLNPPPGYTWSTYWVARNNDYRISALLFAIPSVLSIGMIYLLARRAGAGEAEALLGAFLLAASNTFFIYSKHFLPYDASMLIGLAALWLSIRNHATNFRYAMVVGLMTYLCFSIYNGHITFAVMIALIYCIYLTRDPRAMLVRALGMATGAAIIFLPIVIYNAYIFDIDVLAEMRSFSTTATLGEFSEGIVYPFLYFGDSEAGIALLWLFGLAMAVWNLRRQWQTNERERARLWFACLIVLYFLLSLFSTVLEVFVVYGRIARTLAPFIILLCTYAFAPLLAKHGIRAVSLFVIAVCTLALANFIPVIKQEYFIEVARRVSTEYEDVSFETTLELPSLAYGVYGKEIPDARYKLLNAGFYYPITELQDRPPGEILMEVPHPFNLRPWQYEGWTAEMRETIRRNGFMIWLIDAGI